MLQLQQRTNKGLSIIIGLFISSVLFYLMPCLIHKEPEVTRPQEYINYVDVVRIRKRKEETNNYKKTQTKRSKRLHVLRAKAVYVSPAIKLSQNLNLPFKMNLKLPAFSQDIPIQPVSKLGVGFPGIKGIFTIGEVDSPPIPMVQIPPVYPISARMKGIEGWVVVRFIVDEKGKVSHIQIVESKPKGIFEDSVIKCVSRWRFKPAVFEQVKVKTLVQTKIRFKLK